MADTVTSTVLHQDNRRYVLHLTNLSDGTGESGEIKVDKSAMSIKGENPAVSVGYMSIDRVFGFVHGFTYIQLLWDHDTDDVALTLGPGNFDLDFSSFGGVADPQSAGGTGDLLLTTVGASANDLYDITIEMRFWK